MTAKDINKRIEEYKALQRMAEELNQELETLKDELKAEMTARNTEEIATDKYKVTWKTVKSNRFDSKSFKADYSDLYTQYSKQTESKRFTVQ